MVKALGLALVGVLSGMEAVAEEPLCMGDKIQEEIRSIMIEGAREGLKRQATAVFNNWLKDPTDQPGRATRGMRNGIIAYVRARKAMEEWDPPRCEEKR